MHCKQFFRIKILYSHQVSSLAKMLNGVPSAISVRRVRLSALAAARLVVLVFGKRIRSLQLARYGLDVAVRSGKRIFD